MGLVRYIYLHENHKKSTIHVGKYTRQPMDGMGYGLHLFFFTGSVFGVLRGVQRLNQLKPVVWKEDEVQNGVISPWFYEVNIEKTIMKPKHHPSLDRWLVLGWSVYLSLLIGKKEKCGQDGIIFSRIGGFKQTDQCRAKQKGECVKHAHLLIQHPLEGFTAPAFKRVPFRPF